MCSLQDEIVKSVCHKDRFLVRDASQGCSQLPSAGHQIEQQRKDSMTQLEQQRKDSMAQSEQQRKDSEQQQKELVELLKQQSEQIRELTPKR